MAASHRLSCHCPPSILPVSLGDGLSLHSPPRPQSLPVPLGVPSSAVGNTTQGAWGEDVGVCHLWVRGSWAHACWGRAGSCHHVGSRRRRRAGAKQEEDSRTKTWEAGAAGTSASGWVKKPLDGGPGGHARRPRPAQLRRCVGEWVCAKRGLRRGRWCWGRGDSGCRLQGLSFRVGFSATVPAPRGRAGPRVLLHGPAHTRAARAAPLLRRWGEAPRGPGPLPGGKQSLGTRLGLKLVPPLDSGGGAVVGVSCGPGPATSHPSARGSRPHPFLRPCPGWRRAGVFSREAEGLWAPSALLCWQTQQN